MELEELERNLFARYGDTATGKTVTSGNVVAKVAKIAVAKPANEHITEAELKVFQYDEKRLTRYFISELCDVYLERTEQVASELARGMIERGSYLPPHEHMKYLECESEEQKQ